MSVGAAPGRSLVTIPVTVTANEVVPAAVQVLGGDTVEWHAAGVEIRIYFPDESIFAPGAHRPTPEGGMDITIPAGGTDSLTIAATAQGTHGYEVFHHAGKVWLQVSGGTDPTLIIGRMSRP
jgi:plastocyanin